MTSYVLRDAIVGQVQSLRYSINARAFGPRTPHRVGGLAGDVMRSWVIVVLTIYLYWIKGILRGHAIRSDRFPIGTSA